MQPSCASEGRLLLLRWPDQNIKLMTRSGEKKNGAHFISCDDESGCASGVSCGRLCGGLYLGDDWPPFSSGLSNRLRARRSHNVQGFSLEETITYNRLLAQAQVVRGISSPEKSGPRAGGGRAEGGSRPTGAGKGQRGTGSKGGFECDPPPDPEQPGPTWNTPTRHWED